MHYCTLFLIQILYCISLAVCSNDSNKLVERIQLTHSLFSGEGPTNNVLEQYNSMVRDLESQLTIEQSDLKDHLPQLYFRKALIEINLHKENLAIQDLKKCLDLDPVLKPARTKLIDILLEKGDFSTLTGYLTKEDQEVGKKIELVKKAFANAEKAYNKKDFVQCTLELENTVIPITPSSPNAYQLHLKCIVEIYSKLDVTENQQLPSKLIISDLNKLISLQPMSTLLWYESMAKYLLFTEVQFEKSWLFVKNCLKIDNDYKGCGQISKFYVKFQKFLGVLEEYSINNGHYYLVNDNNNQNNQNVNEDLNKDVDFKFVNDFLLHDEVKVSKIEKKKLSSSIKNNYDYLLSKASAFVQTESGNDRAFKTLSFKIDLDRILCESFIQLNDFKKAGSYCSKIEDTESPFLPKYIPEIDQLLAKKKNEEAKRLLERFNVNVRRSKLFRDRYEVIGRYTNQQRQQQQQRQRQQQQQQQRQWQQRQQQQHQRAPPNRKPSTDYYKILDISRDADEKTIKKAYRTQTLKFHPDKYKGNDLTPEQIENKMQDINQAYEVLADKELRERYDRGDDPNDPLGGQRQQQQPFGGSRPFGGGGGQQYQFNFGQNDFMKQFMKQKGGSGGSGGFGGFGFGGQNQRTYVKKNAKKNK